MCDDYGHDDFCNLAPLAGEPSGITRRSALRAGLLLPVAAWLASRGGRVARAGGVSPRIINSSGETARVMAMHLHGSFSEGTGSWEGHFAQAALNHVDVIMPADHDWRARLLNYRQAYHFTGMSEVGPDGTWRLRTTAGTGLATGSGATISPLQSPADSGGGSLHVLAKAAGTAAASLSVLVDDGPARKNYHGTLLGRTLGLSIYPVQSVRAAAMALRVTCSLHPSVSQQPLQVLYRFCTDLAAATYGVKGGVGTVTLPVTANSWNTLTFDLQADLQQLWPGIIAADNAISLLELVATGSGSLQAEGNFAALTLTRTSDYNALSSLDSVIGAYRSRYPGLFVMMGSEDSFDQHFCRIGGTPFLYDYPATGATNPRFGNGVAADQVAQIKANGGVASLNHPYGVALGGVLSQSQQDAKRASTAQSLLGVRAFRADVLEVGYASRGGVDLKHHQQLWDTLSRNGLYLTADGVSDDHGGKNWVTQQNRFVTCPWTGVLDEPSLLAALRSGRAYVGLLGTFVAGAQASVAGIDLDMEGVRMGQVSLRTDTGVATRTLTVNAQGLPAGSQVVLVQGPVDYAGKATPAPGTSLGPSLPASAFAGGPQAITVDTSVSTFVRADVIDSSGRTIAFSNPIWQLRETPPSSAPVPANRLSGF